MFDWMTFHGLAVELATREDVAAHRSAVSRAYYAAFHAALTHAERRGASLPKVEKHAALWQWFDPPQPIPGRTRLETRIGKNGRRLRASASVSKQLAESMQLAQSLLVDLDELGGMPRPR
ncbi:hypothetical protein OV203_09480 [Nannocystis sp. ILAH1]|uniref:hypothetical protein n=1 Tax=Nannocystis sp. ILAH1 TaxID=2996789 RepID=UPI00226FBE4C|nr:hypothetical protein [Nannocystis sp. ILAH1]MCY0987352.1 hypothetical protein [Nannocystis sp. ILAH1]